MEKHRTRQSSKGFWKSKTLSFNLKFRKQTLRWSGASSNNSTRRRKIHWWSPRCTSLNRWTLVVKDNFYSLNLILTTICPLHNNSSIWHHIKILSNRCTHHLACLTMQTLILTINTILMTCTSTNSLLDKQTSAATEETYSCKTISRTCQCARAAVTTIISYPTSASNRTYHQTTGKTLRRYPLTRVSLWSFPLLLHRKLFMSSRKRANKKESWNLLNGTFQTTPNQWAAAVAATKVATAASRGKMYLLANTTLRSPKSLCKKKQID